MRTSSLPIASDGVTDREREEAKANGDHDDIQHVDTLDALFHTATGKTLGRGYS